LPRRDRVFSVVGVEGVSPTEFTAFRLGDAQEVQERLAGVGIFAVLVADPDAVVNGFANRLVYSLVNLLGSQSGGGFVVDVGNRSKPR
jgi:hypothetical protein